jgi:hypothetical protein
MLSRSAPEFILVFLHFFSISRGGVLEWFGVVIKVWFNFSSPSLTSPTTPLTISTTLDFGSRTSCLVIHDEQMALAHIIPSPRAPLLPPITPSIPPTPNLNLNPNPNRHLSINSAKRGVRFAVYPHLRLLTVVRPMNPALTIPEGEKWPTVWLPVSSAEVMAPIPFVFFIASIFRLTAVLRVWFPL